MTTMAKIPSVTRHGGAAALLVALLFVSGGFAQPLSPCVNNVNGTLIDSDSDGLPDACDGCPQDAYPLHDLDSDGVCNSQDVCPQDAHNDIDADGMCANDDPCPLDPLNDVDGDGACFFDDPCPLDALDDSDGDGVCDSDDVCDGGNDRVDIDGDGVPDDCDVCPLDAPDDADGDGHCDTNRHNVRLSVGLFLALLLASIAIVGVCVGLMVFNYRSSLLDSLNIQDRSEIAMAGKQPLLNEEDEDEDDE